MGFAITWCAVREEKAEAFLQRLGLVPTSKTEEFPESLTSTVRLSNGWRILWYNRYGCEFLGPESLRTLSVDCDLLVS